MVENAKDILFYSQVRKSMTVMFNRPVKDFTKYWLINGSQKLSGDVPILLYRDGAAQKNND